MAIRTKLETLSKISSYLHLSSSIGSSSSSKIPMRWLSRGISDLKMSEVTSKIPTRTSKSKVWQTGKAASFRGVRRASTASGILKG